MQSLSGLRSYCQKIAPCADTPPCPFDAQGQGGARANGPRYAAQFEDAPALARALAPYLGGDKTSIHAEIGYSDAEIDASTGQRVLVSQPHRAPFPFRQVNTATNDRNRVELAPRLMVEKIGGLVQGLLAVPPGIFY